MIKIAPSILAADFKKLGVEIDSVEKTAAAYLHIDIMDGVFVPNISFGPHVISSIRPATGLTFDVHLMIHEPLRFIEPIVQSGADIITFHAESTENPRAVLEKIKLCGKKAGIAIKPGTDPKTIKELLPLCDMVLVMTVMPGFGSQKLIPDALDTVKTVYQMTKECGVSPDIEVDGGINPENVSLAAANGANVIVAGSAVFCSENREATVRLLHRNAETAYLQNVQD